MSVLEKLGEIEFIFMTLQKEDAVERGLKLVREVIAEKFGAVVEKDDE